MEAIQAKTADVKGFKKKVGKWATKKGIKGNYRRQSRLVTFKYFKNSKINLGVWPDFHLVYAITVR